MAGRNPKATALKLVAGNPGKRPLNKHEPEPDLLFDLTPPQHLDDDATAVWNDAAPKLAKTKILTVNDSIALEMLSVAVAGYRKASAMVRQDGIVFENGRNGSQSISQAAIAQSMYFKQVMAVAGKFGMTPADRARLTINPQGDLFSDPADAFFAKKK